MVTCSRLQCCVDAVVNRKWRLDEIIGPLRSKVAILSGEWVWPQCDIIDIMESAKTCRDIESLLFSPRPSPSPLSFLLLAPSPSLLPSSLLFALLSSTPPHLLSPFSFPPLPHPSILSPCPSLRPLLPPSSLPGGRDRRGGPIITITGTEHSSFRPINMGQLLSYLSKVAE